MWGNCQLPSLLGLFFSPLSCRMYVLTVFTGKSKTKYWSFFFFFYGTTLVILDMTDSLAHSRGQQNTVQLQTSTSWCNYPTTGCGSPAHISEWHFHSIKKRHEKDENLNQTDGDDDFCLSIWRLWVWTDNYYFKLPAAKDKLLLSTEILVVGTGLELKHVWKGQIWHFIENTFL